jgi:glycerophosphoryl diester phosphodiesterase
MHDDTLTRTTSYNGSATVAQMTLAEIKEYFLWGTNDQYKSTHPDEKVPTFEEMLIALKDTGVKIFVELKGGDSAFVKKAMELVKKHGYQDRVFVISFSGSLLEYTQLHMPEMGTGLLSSIGQFETEEEMYNSLYGAMLNFQGSYKSTYNPSYGGLTSKLVAALRDRGITIWPWTFNNSTKTQFQDAFLASVGGITTDTAQYSKNMARKVYAEKYDFTLNVGEDAAFKAEAVLYAGTIVDITTHRSATIKFIEGEDVISIEDGKITALKDGTASFMIRYNVRSSPVGQYNLYTQPITVTVGSPSPDVSDNTVSNDVSDGGDNEKGPATWIYIVGAVAVVAVVAVVVVVSKKKK